jgi:DNA helicase-2/ATP-dependent DNA helicase PcrA
MLVLRLEVRHFRGFTHAVVLPRGHALVVGEPRAGRSDLLAALKRVLDPDATKAALEEWDFHGRDLGRDIEIEVVLGELAPDLHQRFLGELEFWDPDRKRPRPGVRELLLPAASHRDPTQVLPTAAEDIRRRRFDTPSVQRAVHTGRLVVHAGVTVDVRDRVVAAQLAARQASGHATVGVFARTNARTADLSAALTGRGVEHVPIGFPEAYGEALSAMATMAAYAAGRAGWDQVARRLAVFLTATDRASQPPALALGLVGRAALPPAFARRVDELHGTLSEVTDPLGEGADVARAAWSALGVTSGYRPWTRAAATFAALAARARLLPDVTAALERV